MLFRALACDYDGTLVSRDRMGAETVSALESVRATGLRLILVTGRTFFELLRVCEHLDLFDAVVAENGGVLYLPAEKAIRDLGPPPPSVLLVEFDRRGVPYQAGRVVVGLSRGDEGTVREAMTAVGVRCDMIYNRSALMGLPLGVSKGTGVRHAIRELGLSFHDVLAIGDAENDRELFEVCGWTACPTNAIAPLQEQADWIFPGEDGAALVRALRGPILNNGSLPPPRVPRHEIKLGWSVGTGEPVTIPARRVNVLIHGDSLSGKSWLAGALVERLVAEHYAVCVIDPEGDFQSLGTLPGVRWMQMRDGTSWEKAAEVFLQDPAACVVVDLSTLSHPEKLRTIESGLELIGDLRCRLGLPHWVVVDEVHYLLHPGGVRERVIPWNDKGLCLVTYRASWLRRSALEVMDIFLLSRVTLSEELEFLRGLVTASGEEGGQVVSALPHLPPGQFVLIRPEGTRGGRGVSFIPAPRKTTHVRHVKKYVDTPLPPEKYFLFRHPDGRVAAVAENLSDFRRIVTTVDPDVLGYHASRGDLSRWLRDVFSDESPAVHLRKIETRWSRGELPDLREAIAGLIAHQYGETSPVTHFSYEGG